MSSGLAIGAEGGRWKRYPAYRDSGVEWLGAVPEGWKVKPLKFIARIETGNTPSRADERNYDNGVIPWVKPDDLGSFIPIADSKDKLTEFGISFARLVPKGSALVCCIGTVGKVGIAGCDLTTNQQINAVIFDHPDFQMRYGQYALIASKSEYEKIANTVVVSIINKTSQSGISYTIPPPPEQRIIAAFLDHETGRIDALIAKKGRQIELLQEKRAALISHAVTKGLDPDAPMKDSGIEWLGEVPEGWEILALKRLASLKSGESITVESIDKDGDYPVFGGNGLRGYTTTFTHDGNYVLIGRQGALCGNINYTQGKFWASEHAVVVSPIGPVEAKWLGELLRAMNLNQYSVSAAQPGLSAEMVSNLSIPQPPLQEQSTIAAFLNRETGRIDALTIKVHESITKLREYRTALISAAVTGKIDVRGESAP